tara:strand:- start:374 stop:613 length:240 start_codon:yes stop_codon:yes gene_type:complete
VLLVQDLQEITGLLVAVVLDLLELVEAAVVHPLEILGLVVVLVQTVIAPMVAMELLDLVVEEVELETLNQHLMVVLELL